MANTTAKPPVTETIRRQAAETVTRRYARSLPQFRVATDIPQYMRDMLTQIEEAARAKNRIKN